MKVLFLDVDGVLNSLEDGYSIDLETEVYWQRLKKILDATQAKIVLSSSWRIGFNPNKDGMSKTLVEKLDAIGAHIHDMTPILHNADKKRGDEIREWLQQHPDVDKFAILDDDQDMREYTKTHLVKTNTKIGLQDCDVEKAIELLRGE